VPREPHSSTQDRPSPAASWDGQQSAEEGPTGRVCGPVWAPLVCAGRAGQPVRALLLVQQGADDRQISITIAHGPPI